MKKRVSWRTLVLLKLLPKGITGKVVLYSDVLGESVLLNIDSGIKIIKTSCIPKENSINIDRIYKRSTIKKIEEYYITD